MTPDDFESCYACDCSGCDHCMQFGEHFEEIEFYGTAPDDLACSCGSDWKIPFRKAPVPASTGLCRNGCGGIELDSEGLVGSHDSWYSGGRRRCYGSGQAPKGGRCGMSITLVIPDTHVRYLRDSALINRLAADVLIGLHHHHRTGLIAGCRVPLAQSDPADDDTLVQALQLARRQPGTARVTRHDGWTDVTLMPGYTVALYRRDI